MENQQGFPKLLLLDNKTFGTDLPISVNIGSGKIDFVFTYDHCDLPLIDMKRIRVNTNPE